MSKLETQFEEITLSHLSFKFIDLFAGIGGFHHALAALGGECVMACELDPECRLVYRSAFPELTSSRFIENIRTLTRRDPEVEDTSCSTDEIAKVVPDHDVLCGGFPCQPFSKSGAQLGVRDKTRGTLFFDILEILRAKHPKFVILENVRNLVGPRHTETWNLVVESLRDVGYLVSREPLVLSPHLIPPNNGGSPQVRDRVFILGEFVGQKSARRETSILIPRHPFPGWSTDSWKISDYLDEDSAIQDVAKYRLSDSEETWLEAWDYFVKNIPTESIPGHPIWAFALMKNPPLPVSAPVWEKDFTLKNEFLYLENKSFINSWLKMKWGKASQTVLDFPKSRQKFEWQARRRHPASKGRTLRDLVVQMRPSGIRVKPATYLPALVAITQTSIVGPEVKPGILSYRKLTPIEAARMQGIPSEPFLLSGVSEKAAYKQLGNAVNVGVAKFVAETVLGLRKPIGSNLNDMPLFTKV